jgi:hypothetical protein
MGDEPAQMPPGEVLVRSGAPAPELAPDEAVWLATS